MGSLKGYIKKKGWTKFDIIFYVVVIGVFLFTRLFKILTVPYGIHIDEASMGLNVKDLVEYGVDRYNKSYPIYFDNANSGQSALYVYVAVLLAKIFGYSLFLLRFVSTLFGGVFLYFSNKIALKVSGKRCAKVLSVLIIALPFFITSQRFAFDCYAILPMFVMTLYWFMQMIDTRKKRYAILTGVGIALTCYSYILSIVILPTFAIFALVYLIVSKQFDWKLILITLVTSIVCALPFIYYLGIVYGVLPEVHSFITITKASITRANELGYKNHSIGRLASRFYILLTKDNYDFTSSGVGVIYKNDFYLFDKAISLEFVLFIIALTVFVVSMFIKRNKSDKRWLILATGVASVTPLLFLQQAVIYRHSIFYFFIAYVFSEFFCFLVDKKFYIAYSLCAMILVGNFASYINSLLFSNEIKLLDYFDKDLYDVCEYLNEQGGYRDYDIYIDNIACLNPGLICLYSMDISPEDYAKDIKGDYSYNIPFANLNFGITGNTVKEKSIYVVREFSGGTRLYTQEAISDNTLDERVALEQQLVSNLQKMEVKYKKIGSYRIYKVD